MSYKPEEGTFMAYLYGELEGEEKAKFEQHLQQNPQAREELGKFQVLRKVMGTVSDKEVIAPPIFVNDSKASIPWHSPYLKTIVSIAASLLLLMVVGKVLDMHINYVDRELKIAFGDTKPAAVVKETPASLTAEQVQQMITASVQNNNMAMQASLKESQQKLDASIQKNLASNSTNIDQLVREASQASKNEIQQYVANMQSENVKLVKDYFQLTSTDQKKYIEDLLIDFAKYMKQQQNNDLQVVQTRLNSLEKNTDIFKQETEQILSSIITNATTKSSKEINN